MKPLVNAVVCLSLLIRCPQAIGQTQPATRLDAVALTTQLRSSLTAGELASLPEAKAVAKNRYELLKQMARAGDVSISQVLFEPSALARFPVDLQP